ncbi:hypothetical protein EXIGLDRAFT_72007 [Exidia glandulosa HHB12029]|uniref:Uncharacterized protein n=1 Tax=Exidia glandulosa HHB12029 TaxID=1314781 RepID=A0A165HX20_EXIGL|nr:hypothetical protein EXIGLDRAFT_72007 [Exidia glandulosa HHB12029]
MPSSLGSASVTSTPASRALFNIVSLAPGLIGLPMLLLAIFFGRNTVKRGAVYLNFIVSVTLLALALSLLPLAGQQSQLYPDSRSLCFVQTALGDAALAMTPVSILALVLELGIGLQRMRVPASTDTRAPGWTKMFTTIAFIILPYVAFTIFGLRDIMYFMRIESGYPDYDVLNPAFYCKLSTVDPFIPLAATEAPLVIFIAVMSCLTLLAEGTSKSPSQPSSTQAMYIHRVHRIHALEAVEESPNYE